MERRVGVLVAVVVGMLAAVTPVLAQEAQPSSAPAAVTEPAATPAPAPEASSMPAATPLSPVAEATPAAPAAPAATPTPAAGPKERKYGYLAVLGVGSMAAGAVSLALAGASLLNPFVVLNGLNFIERDTDGLVIPGTGTSINPFYALGGVLLVLGITLGTAGLVMLGVETYLNGGF
jgi:hypothetical protein